LTIDKKELDLTEEEADYLDRTFGVLRLSGEEEMFAIDGQHRTAAIKVAVIANPELCSEEVPVVFVAHRKTKEGEIRTRRLFSTLNRYAKPVSISEIIALDEEDNAAILTRKLIEQFPRFSGKIAFAKGKSLSPTNKKDFTNIILLYEIIVTLLTKKVFIPSVAVDGYEPIRFTTRRLPEQVLNKEYEGLKADFNEIIDGLPFLQKFFATGTVNRAAKSSNLLFRPVGQIVFFNVYRIAGFYGKKKEVLEYFATDTFNITNPVWNKVFVDPITKTLITTQQVQRAAILLLLRRFNINFVATTKDKSILENLEIDAHQIA